MKTHAFNDREGLKIAAEMERRGEVFYRKAARLSDSPETVRVLERLAADEALHRAEFERLAAKTAASDVDYDEETSAYLSAIAADVVFPEGLMALRRAGFNSPEDVLLEAIQSEKDAILFYTELAAHAAGAGAKATFEEIIRQERSHMRLLQKRLSAVLAEG
jgi:rubrerythrin